MQYNQKHKAKHTKSQAFIFMLMGLHVRWCLDDLSWALAVLKVGCMCFWQEAGFMCFWQEAGCMCFQLVAQAQVCSHVFALGSKSKGLPSWLRVKNSLAIAGDMGSIPGLEISPAEGNGDPLQYSCLGNPMARGAWWATTHGGHRVRQNLATKQQQTD